MNDLVVFLVGAFAVIALIMLMFWGILMIKKTMFPKTTVEQEEEPTETSKVEKMPYTAAKLLTKREYAFFMALRPIAQKYNLMICPKIRLADLATVPQGTSERKWFNYIKSKHVDFTICDINLNVKIVIELDDSSHDRPDRQTRDEFVDRLFQQINIKLLHIRQWGEELEEIICKELNITPTDSDSKVLLTVQD